MQLKRTSIVTSVKRAFTNVSQNYHLLSIHLDKGELKKATQPARVLVDEAIANLNKKTGITEMKRQIAMNIIWTRKAYQDVRTNISG